VTTRPEDGGGRDPRPETPSELDWPFCGEEYPPLRGTLSTMVCTKAPHPAAEGHLNEASGLGWRDRGAARLPRGPHLQPAQRRDQRLLQILGIALEPGIMHNRLPARRGAVAFAGNAVLYPLQSVTLLARGPAAMSARRTHVQLLPAQYRPTPPHPH
jgi:hypothetical protein